MKSILFGITFLISSFFGTILCAQIGALVSPKPPDNPELIEGIRAIQKGENDMAEKIFADMMKKHPDGRPPGIDAALSFADSGFNAQTFGRIRFWLEKTAEDFPDDPEAFILLADIAFSDTRYLECSLLTEHAAKLVEKYDVNPERQRELNLYVDKLRAGIAERRGRWPEAVTGFQKLHEKEPEVGIHLYRLGMAQYRLGEKDAAIESLKKAEKTDPQMPPALIVLARFADGNGEREEAVRLLGEALLKNGENPRTLVAAADLQLKWHQTDKAKKLAELAKSIDPKSADAELTLGLIDLYVGDFQEAERKFLHVIESLPENSRAITGLAMALCEQDDVRKLRRAHTLARLNADRNPTSVDAQTTLAWILVQADSLDEAEKILMRQFELGEMNSPGAYYMGVIYSKQKRNDQAIPFLQHSLETKVNFPKRAEAEKLLKSLTEEK